MPIKQDYGLGSIPAWAGEPRPLPCRKQRLRVYPRVGGGTCLTTSTRSPSTGLSPRGRGNPVRYPERPEGARSIPAWAGEPLLPARSLRSVRVYPRVGGGTDSLGVSLQQRSGLSPRGRGNRRRPVPVPVMPGSIPAWAGEPLVACRIHSQCSGLSPRGRGNLGVVIHRVHRVQGLGSIPAWAGEPQG